MDEQKEDPMVSEKSLAVKAKQPGFWREIWQQARLVYRLVRDSEVPFYLKFLPFLAVAYVLFPFDLISDFAPLLGQVDDGMVLLIVSKLFIELAPPVVVARHMAAIREQDGYGVDDEVADAIVIDALPENEK
ncbi:MAG: YkvA family protein [Anaerolineae bacterium]